MDLSCPRSREALSNERPYRDSKLDIMARRGRADHMSWSLCRLHEIAIRPRLDFGKENKPKRGGTRVIYFHLIAKAQIRVILINRKGIKDDLTPKKKTILRKFNAEWF
jgi:hypothetical protein